MSDADRDEELLDRFRQWLRQSREEAERVERNGGEPQALHCETEGGADFSGAAAGKKFDGADLDGADCEFGLYQLIEEFTALRQELKLQTRSARGLDEQVQTLLTALSEALDAVRSIKPKEAEAAWSAGKALALALAELDEALDRGRQQLEKSGRRLIDEPAAALRDELETLYAAQDWWRRRSMRRYHEQIVARLDAGQDEWRRGGLFDALLAGYSLIQQRLTRTLAAEGISRIAAVGHAVDPERMIVVEAIESPDSEAGTVIEELRRGYLWNGRLLRYAEVRAARGAAKGFAGGADEW